MARSKSALLLPRTIANDALPFAGRRLNMPGQRLESSPTAKVVGSQSRLLEFRARVSAGYQSSAS
jgi:hypothetical protein